MQKAVRSWPRTFLKTDTIRVLFRSTLYVTKVAARRLFAQVASEIMNESYGLSERLAAIEAKLDLILEKLAWAPESVAPWYQGELAKAADHDAAARPVPDVQVRD